MNLATSVLPTLLELEQQTEGIIGWDAGAAVWWLHSHEEPEDAAPVMLCEGFQPVHPMHLLQEVPTLPQCVHGLIASWEAWHSPTGFEPAHEAPDRIDIRYIACALRDGPDLLLVHVRNEKPRITLMDPIRAISYPNVGMTFGALRQLVNGNEASGPPPLLQALLNHLREQGGEGGFFIVGGA